MSRSRQVCALLIFTFAAVACGGGSTSENPAMLPPTTTARDLNAVTCAPSGTSLVLSAQNTTYDKDCLAAPAGQPFTISFANRQKGFSHNIVIVKSQEGEVLFRGGDPFPGIKTEVYNVPPFPAGEYRFHCEVHPGVMKGKFVVS